MHMAHRGQSGLPSLMLSPALCYLLGSCRARVVTQDEVMVKQVDAVCLAACHRLWGGGGESTRACHASNCEGHMVRQVQLQGPLRCAVLGLLALRC